jgi:hypothetical protein
MIRAEEVLCELMRGPEYARNPLVHAAVQYWRQGTAEAGKALLFLVRELCRHNDELLKTATKAEALRPTVLLLPDGIDPDKARAVMGGIPTTAAASDQPVVTGPDPMTDRDDNCQIIGFRCDPADLCGHCRGTGAEPRAELCQHCDLCFDEAIGWSTGIEPGSPSQEKARAFVAASLETP